MGGHNGDQGQTNYRTSLNLATMLVGRKHKELDEQEQNIAQTTDSFPYLCNFIRRGGGFTAKSIFKLISSRQFHSCHKKIDRGHIGRRYYWPKSTMQHIS